MFEHFDMLTLDMAFEMKSGRSDDHQETQRMQTRIESVEKQVGRALALQKSDAIANRRELGAIPRRESASEQLTEEFRLHREVAKFKLEDMAGCLQGRVENRMSALHATLYEQAEEVHLRCDAQPRSVEEATASLSWPRSSAWCARLDWTCITSQC